MAARSFLPRPALKPYIRELVIDETETSRLYLVLPDTSLVMGFQYKGRLSYIAEPDGGPTLNDPPEIDRSIAPGPVEIPLAPSGITGLMTGPRRFKYEAGTGSVLVFFRPGRAAPFFDVPLHELHGSSRGVEDLWKSTLVRSFEERLAEAGDAAARIALTEEFLLSRLRQRAPDPLVSEALRQIFLAKGHLRIGDLALRLHSSPSPLEKRFRREVGATPKQFASLVRFRAVIDLLAREPNLTAGAYEAGYADQAHFIRDFKAFTGETPSRFFKGRR